MSFEITESFLFPSKKERPPSRVRILEKRKIGEGTFGVVYEILTEIERRQKKRRKRFAIKIYREVNDYFPEHDTKTRAMESLKNYTLAKEAGLKVLPTYRLDKSGTRILMTLGHSEEWVCLGSNLGSSSLEDFGGTKLEEIVDFDVFLVEYFGEALKAAENGIQLDDDAFFFFLKRNAEKKSPIDFVLGDYDLVRLKRDHKNLFFKNIDDLCILLRHFLDKNISSRKNTEDYIRQLETFVEQFIEKNKELCV